MVRDVGRAPYAVSRCEDEVGRDQSCATELVGRAVALPGPSLTAMNGASATFGMPFVAEGYLAGRRWRRGVL
jgi:hypothetical protein